MSITRRILKHSQIRWEVRSRCPDGKTMNRRFERLYETRRWHAEITFLAGGDR